MGIRTGYAIPWGRYAQSRTLGQVEQNAVPRLGDDLHGAVPLWLDVGYWLTPKLLLGAYAMYGLVFPKRAADADPLAGGCPEGIDCFAVGIRAGAQVHYSLSQVGRWIPWLGLGLGVEWVSADLKGEVLSVPIQLSTQHFGGEWLHAQGGLDWSYAKSATLGVFGSASATRYSWCAAELSGEQTDCELTSRAWHGWLLLGARMGWDL